MRCAKAGIRQLQKNHELLNHSLLVCSTTKKVLDVNPNLAGEVSPKDMLLAALLHDLGKSFWPEDLFTKHLAGFTHTDRTNRDYHPIVGKKHALKLRAPKAVTVIIGQHHERLDGKGYPHKIKDPLPAALLIGAIDAYCACLEARPYKPNPLPVREALREAAKSRNGDLVKILAKISKDDKEIAQGLQFCPKDLSSTLAHWEIEGLF